LFSCKKRDSYKEVRQQNPQNWSNSTRNWNHIKNVIFNPENENSTGKNSNQKKVQNFNLGDNDLDIHRI